MLLIHDFLLIWIIRALGQHVLRKKNTLFDLKADSELPIAYFAGLIGGKKSEQERILLATAGIHLVCLSDFINDAYDQTSLILLHLK